MPRRHLSTTKASLLNFKNAVAFLPLFMLPLGLLARQGLVNNSFYVSDAFFAAIVILYTAIAMIWLLYSPKAAHPNLFDAICLGSFHFLAISFGLFVSGLLSAFLAAWVVLMVSTEARFKLNGFLASLVACAMGCVALVALYPYTTLNERYELIQGLLIIAVLSVVISRIRHVSDVERVALSRSRQQEAYQREGLLALVNSMGDAVVAADEKGIIKVYNSSLLSLLDTNLDLTGKSLDKVLTLTDKEGKHVHLLDEARQRRSVFSRSDLSYTFSDKEVMHLYINVAPIQPSYRSHAESGFIIILRDITKERTLDEERDEFISVVSHELRTPVTIAEGSLSNLLLLQRKGAAQALIHKSMNIAHDQIIYLAKLINDISALSRAERGIDAQKETLDIVPLLHSLYTNNLAAAQAKKLAFNIDIAHRLPYVVSSPLYLEEIIQNLLTNALKYTPEGSVNLIARQSREGVILEVNDTGIGISKSDQKHIFEKFYR